MSSEDFLYLLLLLSSTLLGFRVRTIENVKQKQLVCTSLGFLMLLLVSGSHIYHAIILSSMNALIVLNTNKRFCHVYSFVFCFLYLIFVRLSEYFGLVSPPEIALTALMIMVLKMVGLAYEVNMHYLTSVQSTKENHLKEMYTKIDPTFGDILHYSFCYAGIFVGPYFKFRTYQDMFQKPYSSNVPHFMFLKRKILAVPLYIFLYLMTDYYFPLSMASSPKLLEHTFLYRLFCMTPWFFTFRMKIYIAFILGECICINLGLGAYPEKSNPQAGEGPTNFQYLQEIENISTPKIIKYNFETTRSMNVLASEFRPSIREGIRYWNMTVQYWLAIYIYRKTNASKPVKMLVTMFVSAIWHGVRPGYYLSLLGTPLFLLGEVEILRAFRKNLSESWKKKFDFVWYFIKMQCIAYVGVAFIIIDTKDILNYWKSIYYVGHIFVFFMFILPFMKIKMSREIRDNDVTNEKYYKTKIH